LITVYSIFDVGDITPYYQRRINKMAKDYLGAIRKSGMWRLMSYHCPICYKELEGKSQAYYGAEWNGGAWIGTKPKDYAWRLLIWQAFRKHFREVHPELIPQVNRSIKRMGLKI